jgi:sigma-B regulation protein RsbU (phosphoserine phosphatase)
VSGKGTPASIMMASVHASLAAMAGSAPPAQLLQRLNRFLFERTQTSRYVTLFYGELDPQRRTLVYVNAGHVPPYLVRADGREERLHSGGPVVGLLEEAAFEAGEVTLAPGDLLTTVTDGVTEAMAPSGAEFGDARVLSVLRAARGRSAQDAVDALVAAVSAWTGTAGCSDDLTVLTLRAT